VGAVVVVLVAPVSLWYVVRGSADGTGCPAARPRVPADAAPAFTFRMPECFKLADAEIVADFSRQPVLRQQLAVVMPSPTAMPIT
jgi:hypothetical protein